MNLIKTLFGGGSAAVSPEQVTEHLKSCLDPNTGKDLVSAKAIKNLKIDGGRVSLDVVLGYPARSQWAALAEQVRAHLLTLAGVTEAEVNVSSQIVAHAAQRGVALLPGVKNIIAIASGKGGVGKSTTTVNLALALAAEGARVGILDADIYGPSQPLLLGLQGRRPESPDNKSLLPLESLGVQSMSIGYLVDDDQAMIWRGPMVSQALQQLLNDTRWDNLDYLLIDMPPGTGDVQLTLSQKIPVTGAVIVTTPQDIALLDAKKGLKMFEKVGVPILGLVENMSVHICSNCGHAEPIFGEGGAAKMAEQYGVTVLGQLPLDLSIRLSADQGKPSVAAEPDGEIARRYQAIARQVAIRVAERARDFSSRIPKIVIQNT
ncbi:iron-sulfur cluster carrier protein ApbC [Rivihabitans pingtungensis]|jgi:ATP-binding protein involved in chromosome partitioning|uniref:iron-sulfur cluster carrier protein ApbC n=2 Tax=Rivihabitans pingtungensis TaxID=1054498 RepID=UPI0023F48260|nr:iron-sulfur cluster carrier protein ApbC [Rivihabitans pingtungensis]HNX70737.1 iron-sulfur cluster carrier protein ApbC [Rivihabitans pingtungensis]